jgi:hypothetical protein
MVQRGLVLDFLNAPHTRKTVVPFERRQVGSEWVQQRREISEDGRFISKTITMGSDGRAFRERVRLFEPGDLATMLADCGFRVTDVCGDYAGNALTATSPRAIIVAQRQRSSELRRHGMSDDSCVYYPRDDASDPRARRLFGDRSDRHDASRRRVRR